MTTPADTVPLRHSPVSETFCDRERQNVNISKILIDAIHYIKKFEGDIFVIKFTGDIMREEKVMETIAQDLVLLHRMGVKPVVVHGGRLEISDYMEKVGMKPKMVNGLRVTDEATMDVVNMVLGKLGGEVVGCINKYGARSVCINGTDANLFVADKRKSEIDLGRVGDIKKINKEIVLDLINAKYIPVISSVAVDDNGKTLNVNADTVAGELAAALGASKLIVLTNVAGVLDENGKLIKRLTVSEIDELINSKKVIGGMIPKLSSCKIALEKGVKRAHVVKASEHGILGEVLTSYGAGTMVTLEKIRE